MNATIKIGSHPIHQAKFLQVYAGCLIYLYGPEVTIHLLVRLLAFKPREILAREYIHIDINIRILKKIWT